MSIDEDAIALHKKHRGKLEVVPKVPLASTEDLSLAYTPGVAAVSRAVAEDAEQAYELTNKGNTVAVVTDGSAVLGLGDIGPEAALPVMEGKAALFKQFADIDAVPICLGTQNVDEIIHTVERLAPGFGGINLEDISAPRCFEIEDRLQNLGIPVFHDDQHGTAIVVLAALMNAAQVVGKNLYDLSIVISGAGAAGTAITKLLSCLDMGEEKTCVPVKDIIVTDINGIIHRDRQDFNSISYAIAMKTNKENRRGGLAEALPGADVFIGVSAGNIMTGDMVKLMNDDPIIFAMANPTPEIDPAEAAKAGAAVVATGRSDYPNQVNNVLAFPGVFRGALDARATRITNTMKLAAANALADLVQEPLQGGILPGPMSDTVVPAMAKAVKKAA